MGHCNACCSNNRNINYLNGRIMNTKKKICDDGSAYEGELLDSMRSGKGSLISPDGGKYEG